MKLLPVNPHNVVPEAVCAAALAEVNTLRLALFGWRPLDTLPPGFPVSACGCPVARALAHQHPPILTPMSHRPTAWGLNGDVIVSVNGSTLLYRTTPMLEAIERDVPDTIRDFITAFDRDTQ